VYRAKITVTYGLDMSTRLYNGTYTVEDISFTETSVFQGRTFAQVITRLAAYVRCINNAVDVWLKRTEKENLVFKLDDETVSLLRVDPAAVVRSMRVPDRTIIIREKCRPSGFKAVDKEKEKCSQPDVK
jgi:hypothetical protein